MSTEKRTTSRGVIVEFDFTAINGAQVLFDAAQKVLNSHGIKLTKKLEALHLIGGNYQGGLRELFDVFEKEADTVAVALELSEAFKAALSEKAVAAVTPGLKEFVKAAIERGIKVVIATRSDVEQLKALFEEFDPEFFALYQEPSMAYGNCKWDAWRRACNHNGLINQLTAAVTGSGNGVKSALIAGLSAVAMVHDEVAYQDFGGADEILDPVFNAKIVDSIARMLHIA